MLGKQLISQILPETIHKPTAKHCKGAFTPARNFKIACRFYYHYTIKGIKYERTLTLIHQEFDLSETRIAQLIMLERDSLAQLKADKADTKYLQKRFPYFNWY